MIYMYIYIYIYHVQMISKVLYIHIVYTMWLNDDHKEYIHCKITGL